MRINAGTLFEDAAERGCRTVVHLDRPFDIAPLGGLSYGMEQLADLVREVSGWLSAAGVRAGDRVAIVKQNHWDINLLAYGAVRLGAVPAPLSAHLPPADLATLIKRIDPSLLVTTPEVVASGLDGGVDFVGMVRRTVSVNGAIGGVLDLDDVRGHEPPPARRLGDDEQLFINGTSGTTGVPKLAVHSATTMVRRLAAFEARRWPIIGCRRSDIVASASAFAHSRTICWTAVVIAASPAEVVILSEHDPGRAGPVLGEHMPTVIEGLPATYIRWRGLAATENNPFRSVRLFLSAYDAVHPSTVRAFLAASKRRHPLWLQAFGQTETGPVTMRLLGRRTMASKQDRNPTTRDQGWPLPLATRVRVVEPKTGRRARPGEPGMVVAWTKGHCVDYVDEHDRWENKVDGWWFNTGDLGIKTRSGKMLLLDREVDAMPEMSCLEIEDVVDERLPEVLECVILGTPGLRPLPVVVTGDGRLDQEAWKTAVRDLPSLAEPVVRTWGEIPRTATGKVRRLALRSQLEGAGAPYGTGQWT